MGIYFQSIIYIFTSNYYWPSIPFVSNQKVYVVWSDTSPLFDQEIFYARSTDGGATFGHTENISNDKGFSSFPAIVASGNNVYIVWRNEPGIDQTGSVEIFYKRSVRLSLQSWHQCDHNKSYLVFLFKSFLLRLQVQSQRYE